MLQDLVASSDDEDDIFDAACRASDYGSDQSEDVVAVVVNVSVHVAA